MVTVADADEWLKEVKRGEMRHHILALCPLIVVFGRMVYKANMQPLRPKAGEKLFTPCPETTPPPRSEATNPCPETTPPVRGPEVCGRWT